MVCFIHIYGTLDFTASARILRNSLHFFHDASCREAGQSRILMFVSRIVEKNILVHTHAFKKQVFRANHKILPANHSITAATHFIGLFYG
jgi:hypothetical protein